MYYSYSRSSSVSYFLTVGICFLYVFRLRVVFFFFFFSSRRRHTRCLSDWSSDVCSSDLHPVGHAVQPAARWVVLVRGVPDARGPLGDRHCRDVAREVERVPGLDRRGQGGDRKSVV